MKKNDEILWLYKSCRKKIIVMRNALIILLFGTFQVLATESYSQTTRLNINMKGVTIKDVLSRIEDESNFYFLYNSKLINVNKKVDLSVKNEKIETVLNQIFDNNKVNFLFKDNHIIISPKETIIDQQKKITGKVVDDTGEPLPGVTVVIKGTTMGTITDFDGNYSLSEVSVIATLVFSFVGMISQEISTEGNNILNVKMKEENIGIEEVVAIGYGTMKKSDLTGSVASIQGEEIAERSPIRVSQALQGTTPGLMVTRGGSAADASASIRIRGITTIGDSNPLIIIDGTPGTLDWVNPNDIESISVLKDAASCAIYGSRAASGVILITTKKAKSGQLKMSYDYDFTIEKPTRLASYVGAVDYMKTQNELSWNDNDNIVNNEYSIYNKELIDNYTNLNAEDPYNYPNTDWQVLMLKDYALRKSHMFNLSVGTEHVQSYISLNVDDTEGLYEGKDYDRYTFRANNDIKINQYFSAEVNFNALYSINKNPQTTQFGKQAVVPGPIAAPIYSAEWPDGRIAPGKGGENPYAILMHAGNVVNKAGVFGGKGQINFTPLNNLKFSVAYSTELFYSKTKDFRKQLNYTSYEDPLNIKGLISNAETTRLDESRDDHLSTTFQILSSYKKSFDKHQIQLMGGFEEYYIISEDLGASRDQYSIKNFPYLNIGNENFQFNSGSASEYSNRSFFGRVIYDFDNKYLFQSNIRYDGSSRFHKDCRWGLFPSFSLGWVVSEESFMKNIKGLNFLKLRASWGTLGNERVGNYPYESTIGFGSTLLFQGHDVVSAQSAGLSKYTIPDISWETTESYDFGCDIVLLDNKLRFTGDYYKKKTTDMLLSLEIPNFIGLDNPQQNTGDMHTNGWELSIGWSDKKGDLRYSANVYLSDFKSIMGDLGGTEFLGSKVKFKGSEYDEWYGYKSEGIFQTQEEVDNSPKLYSNTKPGDVKYTDISGPDGVPDGKISNIYDKVLLGGSLPRYMYGGSVGMGYKNFSLNLVFQGIGKQNSLITQDMIRPLQNYWMDVPAIGIDKNWSHYNTEDQNKKARYPRFSTVSSSNNYTNSDFWLFNGAYFRLKNINLGYNIPENIVSKLKLNSIKLNANVSDLFSIDNYPKGWDPETSSNYWITKSFTMGILVKF